MPYDFTLTTIIPATPQAIYAAWLDSAGHTAMTGGKTAEMSNVVGGEFTAAYGYISGTNLALEPCARIVQSWRTSDFTPDDPDSQIDVLLKPVADGTRLTLHHTNVPDGHTGYEHDGWETNYFAPMRAYFGGQSKM